MGEQPLCGYTVIKIVIIIINFKIIVYRFWCYMYLNLPRNKIAPIPVDRLFFI